MKFTGFEVLDASIQTTNKWWNELMQELNWTDRRKTYVVFRCVLHAWRDHLFFSCLSSYLERNEEDATNAEKVTMAIFRFLERKATYGEIDDLQHLVPRVLTDLWPQALRAA